MIYLRTEFHTSSFNGHKESRNGKTKKKFRKTAILLFYILRICHPNTRGIPFPALAPYIISWPQRSAASDTAS